MEDQHLLGYHLRLSCAGCPESYEVYQDGHEVAYLRLRNGYFYADVGNVTVYEAEPKGDGLFEMEERGRYLTEAVMAVQAYYQSVEGP